jgi:hypothetical protein
MCAEIDGVIIKGKEIPKRKTLHAVTAVKERSIAQRERNKKKDYFCLFQTSAFF